MAKIEDFSQFDIRVGRIIDVLELEGARKPIYVLRVDFGKIGVRSIAAGIKGIYSKEELIGKYVAAIINLDPKNIAGFVSEGMILAAEDSDKHLSILTLDKRVLEGAQIR